MHVITQDGLGGGGDTAAVALGAEMVPSDLLDVVQSNLTRAARRLSHVIDEVEAGRLDQASEAKKATDSLMGFVRLLMEERNKIDKLRKSAADAGAAGGALDFAAARDEIGRRLALLRDAGGH